VKLRMQGACSGCPSSSVTLKSGIENMLMHYVSEVKLIRRCPTIYHFCYSFAVEGES
jgi:Fe-S cluster biogenesis protein NfuA